jgi:hypothetical protein
VALFDAGSGEQLDLNEVELLKMAQASQRRVGRNPDRRRLAPIRYDSLNFTMMPLTL